MGLSIDRKKVIKGFECCIKESEHLYDNPCKNCPYYTGHDDCKINQLHRDAIALLKEQETEKKCCVDCEYYGNCHSD